MTQIKKNFNLGDRNKIVFAGLLIFVRKTAKRIMIGLLAVIGGVVVILGVTAVIIVIVNGLNKPTPQVIQVIEETRELSQDVINNFSAAAQVPTPLDVTAMKKIYQVSSLPSKPLNSALIQQFSVPENQ